jgi:hypothetical protein
MIAEPLTPADLYCLEASWISSELAEQAGIYRVSEENGARLIGREKDAFTEKYAGIVYPYKSPFQYNGLVEHGYRLRRDNPEIEAGKPKNKYMCPPQQRGHFYFGPGQSIDELENTSLPIVLTEGEKKTLALYWLARHVSGYSRFVAMGIPGVWNWRGTIGTIQCANGKTA